MSSQRQSESARAARGLMAGHVALVAFSSIAMVTVLNGPPGPWLAQEPNATVMRLGWKLSGPTYVVLGALAVLLHSAARIGLRRAGALLLAGSAISLGAELLGTASGFPFGDYAYSTLLGYRIAGLVPFPIPLSWYYMMYASLAICGRVMAAGDDAASKWRWAAVAALVFVAWDVSMDPAMVKSAHWIWGSGQVFRDLGFPAWAVAFFTTDVFYGMPLSNWFGWYLTGLLIARVMLAIVPPQRIARDVSPSPLPIVLYAANGVLPVTMCLRDGLWWAAIFGTLAMAIPVGLAWRGGGVLHRRRATTLPSAT
jgi:putative membrane protein